MTNLSILGIIWSPLLALSGLGLLGITIIAPALIWYKCRDRSPKIRELGKAVLNFQITLTLYFAVTLILAYVGLLGTIHYYPLFLVLPLLVVCLAWFVGTLYQAILAMGVSNRSRPGASDDAEEDICSECFFPDFNMPGVIRFFR